MGNSERSLFRTVLLSEFAFYFDIGFIRKGQLYFPGSVHPHRRLLISIQ